MQKLKLFFFFKQDSYRYLKILLYEYTDFITAFKKYCQGVRFFFQIEYLNIVFQFHRSF